MKFYTNPFSPNCRRVALVAAHLGIQLEEQHLDFAKGDTRKPEFLALNASGRVPVLTDGDFALTESRAIIQYLASQKSDSNLPGGDAKERASVQKWLFFDACHLSPPLGTIAFEKLVKGMMGMGEPSPAAVTDALARFEPNAKVLDAQLAGHDWLVGKNVTLADYSIGASLMYAKVTEVSLDGIPNVKSWFGRIRELAAWTKTEPKMG